jgi:protein TonB
MERQFALPIAFAAALHGAVLFGFGKSSLVEAPKEPASVVRPFPLFPPLDQPEPVIEMATESRIRREPDRPQPMATPESPAVSVESDFRFKPPAVEVVSTDVTVRIIDVSPGIRRGDGGDPFGVNALGITALDNVPRARLQPAPLYPHEAKRDGLAGEVVVEFVVDEAGAVREARVLRAAHRSLEEAALRAVLKWRFEPGRRHGRIVPFRMVVPVVFNLGG